VANLPPVSTTILPPVSTKLMANLPLVSTKARRQICHWCQRCRWHIVIGSNDTCGKIATGVNNTSCKQWEEFQTAENLK
jgi:hypothetical protein